MNGDNSEIEIRQPELLHEKGGIRYILLPPELNHLARIPEDPLVFPQEFLILGAYNEQKELVGRAMFITLPHIEGTWVREDLRKGRIGYHLLKTIEQQIKGMGRSHAWAFIEETDKEKEGYMERLGYKRMPFSVWAKQLVKDDEINLPLDNKES